MELYSDVHRALQEEFGTRRMADLLDHIAGTSLPPSDAAFIASRDMFFLSTVDPDGNPTVSYKGGAPGFVRVLDERTLAFPGYDGNGMWLSLGNIVGQGKVGLLFIDFEKPHRFRVQGKATLERNAAALGDWPEAQYAVRVDIERCFVNCTRYIHSYARVAQSRYTPKAGVAAPFAKWKRLDLVQAALPPAEQEQARAEGILDLPTYERAVASGDG